MRTLELGKHRQARVWIGEVPDTSFPEVGEVKHIISATRGGYEGLRLAAVEVFIPLGPRAMYGLLGGQLKSSEADKLQVNISISSPKERVFSQSLASKGENVRVGLTQEYVQSVVAGLDAVAAEPMVLAAGTLNIDCAAHGEVSSCGLIYKHLTIVLIKLLHAPIRELADEELVGLFPVSFN